MEPGIVSTSLVDTNDSAIAQQLAHAAQQHAATGEKNGSPGAARHFESALAQIHEHQFEPLIASSQAAKLLGDIHVKTLQRYARHGELPGYRIAGHWYFRASELDDWLQSRIHSKSPTR